MKLSKFFQIITGVTILALIYIHLQMQIIDLAYQGKKLEKMARNFMNENGMLTYHILKLKSVHNLGNKLLADDQSKLQFLDHTQIVELRAPQRLIPSYVAKQDVAKVNKKANFLEEIFSLKSQAEAQPIR